MTRRTVLRCLYRAVRFGAVAAFDDSSRPRGALEITTEEQDCLDDLNHDSVFHHTRTCEISGAA